jgi:DEAD/DEAH box helicase domain-containing protein
MDKIVIDIETKNTIDDVGGQKNIKDLSVSMIGVYSYNLDKFFAFEENQINELSPILQKTGLIIGFTINRFDIPVLEKYFPFNFGRVPRLDIFEEIELLLGKRISLDVLAKTNLGIGKTHQGGLEAIRLYNENKIGELKNYCLNDVKITRDLYELAKKQGYLLVPERPTNKLTKVKFHWEEILLPATFF